MPNIPTPQGVDQDFVIKNFKRRKAQDILMGQHIKKKFNRQCIIQMPAEERKRLSEIKSTIDIPADQSVEYPKGIDRVLIQELREYQKLVQKMAIYPLMKHLEQE
jgi:hypothetical protein